MKEQDRDILEDAMRDSAEGEDFDEMLLRATKKHLPMKYHVRFPALLEAVMAEADARGLTHRQAAQSLVKLIKEGAGGPAPPVPAAAPAITPREGAPLPPAAGPHERVAGTPPTEGPGSAPSPPPSPPMTGPEGRLEPGRDVEPPLSEERLPEVKNILDLGGADPDSLSTDVKEKLKRMVKVEKKKPEWDGPEEEPDPSVWFKGTQRAPPVVPVKKGPVKERAPEKDIPAPPGESGMPADEEE